MISIIFCILKLKLKNKNWLSGRYCVCVWILFLLYHRYVQKLPAFWFKAGVLCTHSSLLKKTKKKKNEFVGGGGGYKLLQASNTFAGHTCNISLISRIWKIKLKQCIQSELSRREKEESNISTSVLF